MCLRMACWKARWASGRAGASPAATARSALIALQRELGVDGDRARRVGQLQQAVGARAGRKRATGTRRPDGGRAFCTRSFSCTSPKAPRACLLDSTSCRLTTWVERSPIFFCASSMRTSRSRRSVTIWPVAFSVRSSRSPTTLASACSCSRSERSTRCTVSACWLSARASCWRMVSASPPPRRVSTRTSTRPSSTTAARGRSSGYPLPPL